MSIELRYLGCRPSSHDRGRKRLLLDPICPAGRMRHPPSPAKIEEFDAVILSW